MPAPLPRKVGLNGTRLLAIAPCTATVIGEYVAPMGTGTFREVEVALLTDARTAPKYTILLEAIGLKFVPEMMTDVAGAAEIGAKEVMTGTPPGGVITDKAALELRTEPPGFETRTE